MLSVIVSIALIPHTLRAFSKRYHAPFDRERDQNTGRLSSQCRAWIIIERNCTACVAELVGWRCPKLGCDKTPGHPLDLLRPSWYGSLVCPPHGNTNVIAINQVISRCLGISFSNINSQFPSKSETISWEIAAIMPFLHHQYV